jgi:hypothetical protein
LKNIQNVLRYSFVATALVAAAAWFPAEQALAQKSDVAQATPAAGLSNPCVVKGQRKVKSQSCCKFGSRRLSGYAALVFSLVG